MAKPPKVTCPPPTRPGTAQLEVVRAIELLYAIDERDLATGAVADLGERAQDAAALAAIGEIAVRHKDARATLDQTRAKALYTDAVKQIVDDAPYVFVQYQEYIAMYTPKLQSYVINPVANWLSYRTASLST